MSLTLYLLFLIFISGVVAQDGWSVNYNSKSFCTLKGTSVVVECSYTYPSGLSVQKAFWTKELVTSGSEPPDLLDEPDYRGRFLYLGDKHSDCAFRLRDVTEKDQRKYYFTFITDRPGGKYEGADGVDLSVTDLQVEVPERVIEGDNVTLTCKTTCSLTVRSTFTWYRDGHRLSSSTDQLHLQSVSREDVGGYRCAVLGLNSSEVTLNVRSVVAQDGWSVNYNSKSFCTLKGTPVIVECSYKYPSGHSVQKAFWTKELVTSGSEPPDLLDDPEYGGRFLYLGDKHSDCTFRLRDVTEKDQRKYYFTFITDQPGGKYEDADGVDLSVTDLQVQVPERVIEGDNVTLTCKTTCSLSVRSTFTWYRNGHRLSSSTDQLHLQSVSREDVGRYRCAVLSLNSPEVALNVSYPPKSSFLKAGTRRRRERWRYVTTRL